MWGQPKRTAVSGPSPTGELLYQSFFAPPSGVFAFTRAGNAWGFDSTGTLTQAASGISRQVYDPATLAPLGTLLEPASTNQVRNPRCEGATPGTPGTAPTNISIVTPNGLSSSIVAVGSESGIPSFDLRIFGTTTAFTNINISFEVVGIITALTGQTWTSSIFLRLIAGSIGAPSLPFRLSQAEYTSGGSFIKTTASDGLGVTENPLNTQRNTFTNTLSGGATTAYVITLLTISYASGVAVDFTLRIGLPQMEQLPYASSPIMPPVGSPNASTRAADNLMLALPYAGFPGPIGWTAALEFVPVALPGNVGVFGVGTASFNDTSYLIANPSNVAAVIKRVGGTGVVSPSLGALAVGSLFKAALGQDTVDLRGSLNGSPVQAATLAGMPAATRLVVGTIASGAAVASPMHARRLRFWSSKLSDAELQAMTS